VRLPLVVLHFLQRGQEPEYSHVAMTRDLHGSHAELKGRAADVSKRIDAAPQPNRITLQNSPTLPTTLC
jgi:hypothetical protein